MLRNETALVVTGFYWCTESLDVFHMELEKLFLRTRFKGDTFCACS